MKCLLCGFVVLALYSLHADGAVEDHLDAVLQLGKVSIRHTGRMGHGIRRLQSALRVLRRLAARLLLTLTTLLASEICEQCQPADVVRIRLQEPIRGVGRLRGIVSCLVCRHQLLESLLLYNCVWILLQKSLERLGFGIGIVVTNRAHVCVVFRRILDRLLLRLSAGLLTGSGLPGLGTLGVLRNAIWGNCQQRHREQLLHSKLLHSLSGQSTEVADCVTRHESSDI